MGPAAGNVDPYNDDGRLDTVQDEDYDDYGDDDDDDYGLGEDDIDLDIQKDDEPTELEKRFNVLFKNITREIINFIAYWRKERRRFERLRESICEFYFWNA